MMRLETEKLCYGREKLKKIAEMSTFFVKTIFFIAKNC